MSALDTAAVRGGAGSSRCRDLGIAPGCSGSLPAACLIPRDTPRIGRVLAVEVDRLPHGIALMGMGFQRPSLPVPLGAVGMPGCSIGIQVDAVALLAGQGNTAPYQLPIPDLASLVGVRFYQQALVLDAAAGNALGAVLSEAAEGVIGLP